MYVFSSPVLLMNRALELTKRPFKRVAQFRMHVFSSPVLLMNCALEPTKRPVETVFSVVVVNGFYENTAKTSRPSRGTTNSRPECRVRRSANMPIPGRESAHFRVADLGGRPDLTRPGQTRPHSATTVCGNCYHSPPVYHTMHCPVYL